MQRAILLSIVVVAAIVSGLAQSSGPEPAMRDAAKALISAVDAGQRAKLVWPFDDEERVNWHFIPRERQGLPLKEMDDAQRQAAVALLSAGLSASGMRKVEAIRNLEDVLFAASGSATRDRDLYFVTIFGDPDAETWGWRYEGHHLSQNWTVVSGRAISTTPAFMGANPAEVMEGPHRGLRALPAEADLAWQLLDSLTDEQRGLAVVADEAPRDIITGNARTTSIIDRTGLAAAAMTEAQRGLLMRLVEEHASSQTTALAAARLEKARAVPPGDLLFAWMGATTRAAGAGHYYRVQGTTFLIEYDNTQNRANHQHVVWRDFAGDFGDDLLAGHYAADPHGPWPR
jgi:hypothetical protein